MTKQEKCRLTQQGRIVVHKDNLEKRIYKKDLDEYLNNGWLKGFKPDHKKLCSDNLKDQVSVTRGSRIGISKSDDTKRKISNTLKEKNKNYSFKSKTGWTKYWLAGGNDSAKIKSITEKQQTTKEKNNTFNTSKPEELLFIRLQKEYPEDYILRNYKSDKYPFRCDFYIKSKDLYIELNNHWTHGGKPYNPDDKECQEKLAIWKIKAKTSKFYENAIYVWTELDVKKQEIAKKNNLNYQVIYDLKQE